MRLDNAIARTGGVVGLGAVLVGQFGRVSVLADMLNTFLVPLAAMLAVVAVLGLVRRDRWAAGLAFAGCAIATSQFLGAYLAAAPRSPAEASALRVASLNAFHGNTDVTSLSNAVARANPDILMVEEADGAAGAAILALLPRYNRVLSCAAPACSLVILSRWPARRVLQSAPPGARLPDLLVARVEAPFGAIKVVAAHMPRAHLPDAAPFLDMLVHAIGASEGEPVLLGGDLNLPTGSFGLARFERRAGLARAERWIATYPANLPTPALAAIDHVYVSVDWRVHECDRLSQAGSDHFGLTCLISPPALKKQCGVNGVRPSA